MKDWLNIFALAFISFFTHFSLITPRTNLTTRVICAALWSDRVQLVAMYLKSSLIIHPLVWASQLLLFVLAVIRGWGRTRCQEVASILESLLMLFVCVCVWNLNLTRPSAVRWVMELAEGYDSHFKSSNYASFFVLLVWEKKGSCVKSFLSFSQSSKIQWCLLKNNFPQSVSVFSIFPSPQPFPALRWGSLWCKWEHCSRRGSWLCGEDYLSVLSCGIQFLLAYEPVSELHR